MAPSITRRNFFGVAGTIAGFCLVGTGAACMNQEATVLRPPGAQNEQRFMSLCIRCDKCRSVCPQKAIRPATLEDGIGIARTPLIDFHRGICDFCDRCRAVCPTGALESFDKATDKIGLAVIDPNRCLAFDGGCSICENGCPFEAINLNDSGIPSIDEEKCNGCGICENICPASVYRSFSGGTKRGISIEPSPSLSTGDQR